MNTGFYKDLDTNFEQAFMLCDKEFSHTELLDMLKNGNIPERQIAALKFDYVKTEEDASALVNVLTGCDGKIREAVAMRIYQFLNDDKSTHPIFAKMPPKVFVNATIDINANICRLVVDSVRLLREYEEFIDEYVGTIVEYTKQALDELDRFIFRDKKYVINKQLFKLYWCLEGVKPFVKRVDETELLELLERSAKQNEYTVREKVAQIVVGSENFKSLRKLLENDENYYVRAVFLNH